MAATVPPSETLVFDLDLSAAITGRYALQLSSAGVIDKDYRGNIKVILCNNNTSTFKIVRGRELPKHFCVQPTMWTGKKLSNYPVLVWVMVFWVLLGKSRSYSIEYTDCRNPTAVEQFNLSTMCSTRGSES